STPGSGRRHVVRRVTRAVRSRAGAGRAGAPASAGEGGLGPWSSWVGTREVECTTVHRVPQNPRRLPMNIRALCHTCDVNGRTPTEPEPVAESRRVRKLRTRADLLHAALLLLKDKSFSSLSLREVTREA